MPSRSRRRPACFLIVLLGTGALLASSGARAQTFDSTAGTAPSEKLSTPPNAAAINRPGAMERAYGHPAPTTRVQRKPAAPRKPPGTPPPH